MNLRQRKAGLCQAVQRQSPLRLILRLSRLLLLLYFVACACRVGASAPTLVSRQAHATVANRLFFALSVAYLGRYCIEKNIIFML